MVIPLDTPLGELYLAATIHLLHKPFRTCIRLVGGLCVKPPPPLGSGFRRNDGTGCYSSGELHTD